MNVSHMIHDLSFGPKYPGIHNPLDGTTRIVHETSGTFKYYIKVKIRILFCYVTSGLVFYVTVYLSMKMIKLVERGLFVYFK